MQHAKGLVNESTVAQQIINQFDFSSIDDMDPSLDGFRVTYEAEIPFHIRFQDKNVETQDLPNMEPLRVRVFIQGGEKNPQSVKIELSSDNDLFFHFTHIASEGNFQEIKQEQQLNIDFPEYAQICVKCLTKCDKDQHTYQAIFTILSDGEGRLEVIQSTEYKNVEIMSFNFAASSEDFIRQFITFRYMSLKSKLQLMENRLSDVNEIVRLKNPSLLLQIQRQVPHNIKDSQVLKKQ